MACKGKKEWEKPNECYYLKSFVYRLLVFFYWVEKAENDVYSFDFSKAGRNERVYLKYIMTFNYFFCDSMLLKDLNYDDTYQKAHFFREMFKVYVSYIKNDNSLLTYDQFAQKMEKDCSQIMPAIQFLVNVREDKNNCNRNVLASFHLFLMLFLNKYGLDYHETKREVFNKYARKYDIVIKKGLKDFFVRNRISKEVTWIIEELNL